jgi:hypothetical protein
MGISEEKIEELVTEHGKGNLHLLNDPDDEGDEIVVRRPTRMEYHRFKLGIEDEKKHQKAIEQIIRDCTVFPSKTDLDAMLERRPGLADAWGQAIMKLAGAAKGVEAKKL